MTDILALTTYPRAAFRVHSGMPYTYLLQFRQLFPNHQLLLTEIGLPLNEKLPNREEDQLRFLARFFNACYWLDARMVAFPRLTAGAQEAVADFALRVGKTERIALAEWRAMLGWRRVTHLSLQGPKQLQSPDAQNVEMEGAMREAIPNDQRPAPQ